MPSEQPASTTQGASQPTNASQQVSLCLPNNRRAQHLLRFEQRTIPRRRHSTIVLCLNSAAQRHCSELSM